MDPDWLVELCRPSLAAWRRVETMPRTTADAELVAATVNACAQAESPFARRRMTAGLALWAERFRQGRPMAFAHALAETARLECLVAGDDPEANVERAARAVDLLGAPDLAALDPQGQAEALARAKAHLASEYRLAGDHARAEATLERAWTRLDDLGDASDEAPDEDTRAVLLVARGALSENRVETRVEARADLEEAVRLVEDALPGRGLASEAWWRLARLDYAAGDLDAVRRSVERGLRDLPEGLDERLRADLVEMATLAVEASRPGRR